MQPRFLQMQDRDADKSFEALTVLFCMCPSAIAALKGKEPVVAAMIYIEGV